MCARCFRGGAACALGPPGLGDLGLNSLLTIAPTVRDFFDGEHSVMVMDSDPQIRDNRLNLLGLLRNHGRVLADFGAIVKG